MWIPVLVVHCMTWWLVRIFIVQISWNTEILDASTGDMFSFLPKLHCRHFVAQTWPCRPRRTGFAMSGMGEVPRYRVSWDGSGHSKFMILNQPETQEIYCDSNKGMKFLRWYVQLLGWHFRMCVTIKTKVISSSKQHLLRTSRTLIRQAVSLDNMLFHAPLFLEKKVALSLSRFLAGHWPSLKLTFSHLKMDGWKSWVSFWGNLKA